MYIYTDICTYIHINIHVCICVYIDRCIAYRDAHVTSLTLDQPLPEGYAWESPYEDEPDVFGLDFILIPQRVQM